MSEESPLIINEFNLLSTIAKEDTFSTFSRLLGTCNADEIFTGDGGYTVFVPTNDAFGKFTDREMNSLLNERDQRSLKALLSYHVVPGIFTAANISSLKSKRTITGDEVTFSDSHGLKVNESGVQARNIRATDGIVHAIDTVLAPPRTTWARGRDW